MLLNFIFVLFCLICSSSAKHVSSARQFGGQNFGNGLGSNLGPFTSPGFGTGSTQGCPLCDASVYSYCSHKVIHDSCCCDFSASLQLRPPQCAYYDCSLLYAKSCYEHNLIKNCCCNNPY